MSINYYNIWRRTQKKLYEQALERFLNAGGFRHVQAEYGHSVHVDPNWRGMGWTDSEWNLRNYKRSKLNPNIWVGKDSDS
jgi:hypothetical protein